MKKSRNPQTTYTRRILFTSVDDVVLWHGSLYFCLISSLKLLLYFLILNSFTRLLSTVNNNDETLLKVSLKYHCIMVSSLESANFSECKLTFDFLASPKNELFKNCAISFHRILVSRNARTLQGNASIGLRKIKQAANDLAE